MHFTTTANACGVLMACTPPPVLGWRGRGLKILESYCWGPGILILVGGGVNVVERRGGGGGS